MGRRPSLSPNDRAMAVGMLDAGQSARDVARRFGVSHSTILRLNERFQTTRSVKDRPRSGRPKKTTLAQDRYLRNLTLRTRVITARSLQGCFQRATGIRVSDQTVRNRLRAANLRSYRPALRTPLTNGHRRVRRDWCRRHVRWNLRQWSTVYFSDESRFNVKFNDGRIRVYRRKGERYCDVNVMPYNRYGGGSIMVWAGVTLHRRTQLYILNGNLNAARYINEILRPIALPFLRNRGPNAVFQDDNARPHRARVVNDFIGNNNIRRMIWPANSPDLNPIEHVWDELGRRVYRDNAPHNVNELRQRLVQE